MASKLARSVRDFALTGPRARVCALVFVLALVPRVYPALSLLVLYTDSVEYLNIARHVAQGEGPLFSIRGATRDDTPVIRSGVCCRFLGFPLVAAGVLKLVDSLYAVQLLNAVLASGALALLFLVFDRLFGRGVALLAAILLSVHPVVFLTSTVMLTEPLAFFLIAVLLVLWVELGERGAGFYALAGLLVGFTTLVRPTNILLAAALVVYLGLLRRQPQRVLKVLLLAGGIAVSIVPLVYHSLQQLGQLPYAQYGASEAYRTVVAGGLSGGRWLFRLGVVVYYALSLMVLLLPFSVFLPAVVKKAVRGLYSPEGNALLIIALLNVLVHVPLHQVGPRYMELSFMLLLPFCLERLGMLRKRGMATALVLLLLVPSVLIGPLFMNALALRGVDPTDLFVRQVYGMDFARFRGEVNGVAAWIRSSTDRGDVIGAFNPGPHLINLHTGRPAIRLPERLDPEALGAWMVRFQVKHIVIHPEVDLRFQRTFRFGVLAWLPSERPTRKPVFDYLAALESWKAAGLVAGVRVGPYAVYSVTPEGARALAEAGRSDARGPGKRERGFYTADEE